jgi:hypothetical protein
LRQHKKALLFIYFFAIESDENFFLSSEVSDYLLHGVERKKNGGRAATAEA